jgi:hypothetical protein
MGHTLCEYRVTVSSIHRCQQNKLTVTLICDWRRKYDGDACTPQIIKMMKTHLVQNCVHPDLRIQLQKVDRHYQFLKTSS